MRIICSVCLDEVGESLLVLTNCGHVFDRECAIACLNVSDTCPICRKNVFISSDSNPQQPFYRVYLSADNGDKSSSSSSNAKEREELHIKLTAANVRLSALKRDLINARHDTGIAAHNYKNMKQVSKGYKIRLDATLKKLETLEMSNNKLQQQTSQQDALIQDLKEGKQVLSRSQKNLEESNAILKEQIGRKNALVFQQYYHLTNKSNCISCKKLRSPQGNDGNEVGEWRSAPKNLDNLSRTQLRLEYHDLQERYDCLAMVHCEMIKASSGLTESAHVKMYIGNLEAQLKESITKQVQLESSSGRNEMVEQLAKKLVSAKQKQLKLEAELEQLSEAKGVLFDQKNQVEGTLNRALEAILTLQNQKEESIKQNSELQTQLTEATDAKLCLQRQLKSSKKHAKQLQDAKAKIQADNENIRNRMNVLAVEYSSFEKAFRGCSANESNKSSDDWTLTA